MGCGTSTLWDEEQQQDPPPSSHQMRHYGGGAKKKRRRAQADYEQTRRNNDIDAALSSARRANKTVKILLLGAGESGKSTVLKQMRLIHGSGFSDFERQQYTKVIWCDIVQSMRILIQQAGMMGIRLDADDPDSPLAQYRQLIIDTDPLYVYDDEDKARGLEVDEYMIHYGNKYRQEALNLLRSEQAETEPLRSKWQVAEAINQLWKHDRGISQVMSRSNEFQLEVNAQYYFDNVFRHAQPGCKATDTDILVGRIKTTGITETVFSVKGMTFRMFDVGGQRSERKKWIHCFDNVTAVLFVAAVSEYDQVLFEDSSVNRMKESLVLFDSIINSRWFANTPIILFLNKTDILEAKLKKTNSLGFGHYYPQYTGNPHAIKPVMQYLQNFFANCNRSPHRQIYVHQTCATDTATMNVVMQAVTDMILEQNLVMSGII